jgi:hypothetical protein
MKVPTTGEVMKPFSTMSSKSKSIAKTLLLLKMYSKSRNKRKPRRKQQGKLRRREDSKKRNREEQRRKRLQLPL